MEHPGIPRELIDHLVRSRGLSALDAHALVREVTAYFSESVEDYVRRATAGEHLATSDPEEIADFLSERLGVRLEPLLVEGLEVEGAEVCLLDGQLGALIVYKLDGAVLSHYLIPYDEASPREPTVSQFRMAGEGQDVGSDQEVNLVTWASPRLEQALMGSMAPGTMVRLASVASES